MCYPTTKPDFTKATSGTLVYSPAFGFGHIVANSATSPKLRPITIKFDDGIVYDFTYDGRLNLYSELECILFYVNGKDKFSNIPPLPPINPNMVPVDTKVFVKDGISQVEVPRFYYADNKVFATGVSSFTQCPTTSKISYRYFKLAEDAVVDGITYPCGYTWEQC